MPRRPCLTGCGQLAQPGQARCRTCESTHQRQRNAKRVHYHGDYDARAAVVRGNAKVCWRCGEGHRRDDPWQADHVDPGNPASELKPAHRSCNARAGALHRTEQQRASAQNLR